MVDLTEKETAMHRLQKELFERVKNDPEIFNFVEKSSLDGMWYWDLENPEHEWMSEKFWTTLGYDPSERKHLASEWQEIINQDDLANAFENFQKHCADKNHPYDQVVRYLHSNGSTVWIRCRGRAIRDADGKAIRMLGAHVNITAVKQKEIELTQTLQSRERFFARMSHEIRTPLHGMIGLAENLKQDTQDPSLLKTIDTMLECGDQLKSLLNDLLTVSKINENKFTVTVEDVQFSTIIGNIKALFDPLAEQKGIYLNTPEICNSQFIVRSDKTRLTQILSNIVSNAIKFTYSGGVTINIQEQPEHIVISLIDTGVGIEDIESVFDAYKQDTSTALSENQGTGLGLEIVKKLCEILDHSLELQSTVNIGTKVTLKVPLATSQVYRNDVSTSHEEITLAIPSVLIVDDNEINRIILCDMLQDHVTTIEFACDGQEAVDKVKENANYTAILMDLNMPVKDGYAAATEIKAFNPLSNIIAVSASTDDEARKRCLESGIDYFLEKPFNKNNVISILQRSIFKSL